MAPRRPRASAISTLVVAVAAGAVAATATAASHFDVGEGVAYLLAALGAAWAWRGAVDRLFGAPEEGDAFEDR